MRTSIRATRAVALLLIASGAAGAASTLAPSLDERWIFVAAVAVIGAMEGLIIGIISAVAAVGAYELIVHSAFAFSRERDALLLAAGIVGALAARGARVTVTRRRLGESSHRVLLPAPEHEKEEDTSDIRRQAERAINAHLDRIGELQQELQAARLRIGELEGRARSVTEMETQLWAGGAQIKDLESELAGARATTDEHQTQNAAHRARIDEHETQIAAQRMRLAELEDALAAAGTRAGTHESQIVAHVVRIAELEEALAAGRGQAEEHEARIVAHVTRIAELEGALAARAAHADQRDVEVESQQTVIRQLEGALTDARSRNAAYQSRVGELEAALAQAGARAFELDSGLASRQARIEELEAALEQANARAGELDGGLAARLAHIAELENALAEGQSHGARLQTRIGELEDALAEASARAGDHEAGLNLRQARISELEDSLAGAAERNSQLEAAHAAELASRQSHVQRLEDAILAGGARAEKQQARIAELQDAVAENATRAEELQARMGSHLGDIRKLESDLAAAKQQLADGQEREAATQVRIGDLEAEIADAYMFGSELQRTHEKKTARVTELEGLLAAANENTRVAALEGALDTARNASESLAVRVEELEEAVDTLQTERDQALAKLESIEAEWSEKLQTIVTHLASDHEADLGQALLEKEEARAEARSLTARIADLKRMIEEKSIPPEHGFAVVNLGQPRKGSVLLIHHDATLRTMAKHALERSGYRVTTASDGLEALRTAMTEKPDVILADTQMPKMDGRGLVQLLKSRAETANVKIILIGAPVAPTQHTDFHPDDFLRDPGNIEAMRETIENVLASR